ncbi:MAG TPA: DMT family transporter [Candidatus Sulfotelmatobacter sp.]|nr:DMT family transporter [Candidatus Sulfotelmatobacter sp.]
MTTAAPTIAETTTKRPSSFVLGLSLAAMLVMWAVNYVAGKVALRYLDGVTLASFRIVLAALVILPIYLLRQNRQRLGMREIRQISWIGMFLILNQFCFTVGLGHTSAGHSSMILATGPITVLLFARLMRMESHTTAKLIGMGIACAGVAILATEQGLDIRRSATLTGDIITLTGTTIFSVYAVLGKRIARQYDSLSMNSISFFVGAIVFFPLALWKGLRLNWASIPWSGWAGLFYMAAASSVAAYLLFYWVLRYMDASRVTAVNYLQPVGAIIVAALFLGEVPTWHLLAGGALILLGVYLAERGPS